MSWVWGTTRRKERRSSEPKRWITVTEPVRPVFGAPPAAAYHRSMVRRATVWTPLASSGRRAMGAA
jgi:hypothetical protein